MITFLGLVSLDFIDTDFLLEEMFDFRETDAFGTYIDGYGEPQSHFADAGFETSNFIELLGSVFFVILLYASLQLVLALLKILVRQVWPLTAVINQYKSVIVSEQISDDFADPLVL